MFEEELAALIEKASRSHGLFAVMYIDMDRFKQINDTLGHLLGDQLMIQFSSRLMRYITTDDLAARIGGDEFTILLPNIRDKQQPINLAKKIIKALEQPFFIDEHELYITASIGIAIYPSDGDNAQTLLKNADTVLTSINELKKLGIKLALDDFGTGYSSLIYLKNFKVDTVKIDRCFIQDLLESDAAITRSIIHLAHGLNMQIVAEGVETEEQLPFLCHHGCDQIQGYLFSKSVPVEEFSKILAKSVINPNKEAFKRPIREKRKHFRVDLPFPLNADMTIVQIKEKPIELGKTEVLIENIGLGGLRFLTHIQLPINGEITLKFETEILGGKIKLLGHIVWKQEIENSYFQYGLKFTIHESDQPTIASILTKLSLHIRKNPLPLNGRFIKEDKMVYLNRIRNS
jgi:diguanylate cyclase (GGDEF)-like protein